MQRFGQVLGIRPEGIEEYERLHAAVWPEVLATIQACNIRNYSIFRHEELLFACFEHVGEDFASDMAKLANAPKTRAGWAYTEPLDEPPATRTPGAEWVS